jgi:flagellar biosynthesis protein FlhF
MTVKTLTAPTIKTALAEARERFGDDVVLLESHPPKGGEPARIMVMADSPRQEKIVSPEAASISQVIERVKQEPRRAFGYAGGIDFTVEDTVVATAAPAPEPSPAGNRLFPATRGSSGSIGGSQNDGPSIESLLDERINTIHERLNGIEQKFDRHPVSAGEWSRHPLFNRLLDRGLRTKTVTELFSRISADDISDDDALFWAVARELRSILKTCAGIRPSGAQVFIGAGGSGKTSMILRLARHNGFFGRRKCGVIIISGKSDNDAFQTDPTELYRRHGLAVQNVADQEQMEAALNRLVGFDHILIDTPSLPFNQREMRDELARLRPMLSLVVPAQVHFVVSATSALEDVDASLIRRMPVAPDLICVTRMDETSRPGRVAEWLREAAVPVNFLGDGVSLSDGLTAFTPAAFAEQLLAR